MNMNSQSSRTSENVYNDSKYTVADILSSMANGEPVTPTTFSAGSYLNSIVSAGAATSLTPTTLASIEQTFIELQSVTPSTVSRGVSQSGFVPPVVDPIKPNREEYDYDSSDSDWSPASSPAAKRSRTSNNSKRSDVSGSSPARKGGRRTKYEKLSPEEEERRRVRRERNKVAAAKCRQRRVDQTNKLIKETDILEDEKAAIEIEIQNLQQQKEQLEFLLQAHKPMCHLNKYGSKEDGQGVIVKKEPGADCATTSRPSSLPLQLNTKTSDVLGIPITTPSSGVFTLTLDSIVDHTGLTPLTGPSCSSQIQKNGSDSSSPGMGSSPTKLMAL